MKNLRDHGFPLPEHRIIGAPVWTRLDEPLACPNCGAETVVVTVCIELACLTAGVGTGRYPSCPACPWAGPMFITSDGVKTA